MRGAVRAPTVTDTAAIGRSTAPRRLEWSASGPRRSARTIPGSNWGGSRPRRERSGPRGFTETPLKSTDFAGIWARATASKIPVILAVLDGNLVYSYNVYYWHSFNNHPNYSCKSLEYSQNFRSITVSGLPYLMKNPHFDAVALNMGKMALAQQGRSRPSPVQKLYNCVTPNGVEAAFSPRTQRSSPLDDFDEPVISVGVS